MIVHKAWVGLLCGVGWVAGLGNAPARAQEAKPASLQLTAAVEPALSSFLGTQRDALGRGCEPQQLALLRDLRFVACGVAGVWVIRGSAGEYKLVSTQDVGGTAHGFFVHNDRVWVELTSERAVDLGVPEAELAAETKPVLAAPASAPPPTAAKPSLPPDRRVRVTERRDDGVIVEASSQDVLAEGQRIAFYPAGKDRSPDAALRGLSLRAPPLAVGRVTQVSSLRARVALGMNEAVPVGTPGELSGSPTTDSTFAPPRAAGVWHIGFVARPLIVLDDLGAGLFADARVGYRFEAPIHVEAIVAPVAFASARPGLTVPFAAFLKGSFDTRLFEVGLGVGGQTVEDPGFGLDRGSGTLIAQHLRIGAVDGAHLEGFSYIVLFHSDFEFSSLRVQGQIPVAARFWLIAAGGGGSTGLGYGEAGLRTLLSGNGLAGSFFLTATIGGVHMFQSCNAINQPTPGFPGQPSASQECEPISYVGPMIGVGGEWRL